MTAYAEFMRKSASEIARHLPIPYWTGANYQRANAYWGISYGQWNSQFGPRRKAPMRISNSQSQKPNWNAR